MKKTLLIISGGGECAEVARQSRESGHTVVISDSDPQAPAFAFADSCLIADVHGAPETAAAAERYNRKIRKIDGVLCLADAAMTAAMVTERLRLPGMPLHVAELIGDRMAMRRCFGSAGVPTPWHMEIFTPQELQRIVIAKGRDLILKPVDNRGADGVEPLAEASDFAAAFQRTRFHSSDERVLVEQWLDGPRFHLAAMVIGGECHVAGTPDKAAADALARAASAVGLNEGPLVGEIVMHQGIAHVVEISSRLNGPHFLTAAAKLALGETPSPEDLLA